MATGQCLLYLITKYAHIVSVLTDNVCVIFISVIRMKSCVLITWVLSLLLSTGCCMDDTDDMVNIIRDEINHRITLMEDEIASTQKNNEDLKIKNRKIKKELDVLLSKILY